MKCQSPQTTLHQLRWLPLLLAVTACAPDGASSVAETIDACSLLSAEDIASVVGAKVTAGHRDDIGVIAEGNQSGAYSSTCFWRLDEGGEELEYVILMAMNWPKSKSADQFLQEFRNSFAEGVIAQHPIPLSLGDSALWWGDGVAVAKDQISFGVSTRLMAPREQRRIVEEALAAIAVGGL